MAAICLFGALCAVNQSVLQSKSGLDSFDPIKRETRDVSLSPCPSLFRYEQDLDEWHGEMSIENVDLQKNINLILKMTVDTNDFSVSIN